MPILWLIVLVQIILAVRVIVRLLSTTGGTTIAVDRRAWIPDGSISVVVPVYNEFDRLGSCLEKLISCGREVREILVVDGGSIDGTQKIVESFAQTDPRVRPIDATPTPPGWNGKAWNLECGLLASSPESKWIATIDADVRVRSALLTAMVNHAQNRKVKALSVATKQELADRASGIIHPAMLTTLVYRHGLPGNATKNPRDVQANGQCFLARRELLIATNAFARARTSVCEDVTVARILAKAGHRVGFYEAAGELAIVRMHDSWRAIWQNWPRSLTLRDGMAPRDNALGLAEVLFVQALPLVILFLLLLGGHGSLQRSAAFAVNGFLLALRVGVLFGTRRAYRNSTWTYWLSPFADLPVAAALLTSALRRRHTWRGRPLVMSERIT
ncbi:MAG: glycosyltransferase family 2 protein [Candidatus Velthaea sp.]